MLLKLAMECDVDIKLVNRLHSVLNNYVKIPEKEWGFIVPRLSTIELKRGEFFVKEGNTPNRLGFILSGLFRAYYTSASGDERVLVFRQEDKFVTSFSALLENRRANISVQALEDSQLLVISANSFKELIKRDSCWELMVGKFTMELFLEKEKRETEFLSDDAETRYKKFLIKYPGFESRISQYHIASYLGISHVSLSRIRSSME